MLVIAIDLEDYMGQYGIVWNRGVVEVAGIEPASYSVSIWASTSLVGNFLFLQICRQPTSSIWNTSLNLTTVMEDCSSQP